MLKKRTLHLNRNKKGLYLNYFENKKEAEDYLYQLAKTYMYHPKKISVGELIRRCRAEGINIYPATISNVFHAMGVKVRDFKRYDKPRRRIMKSVTVDQNFNDYLTDFDNQSRILELGARLVTGYPSEDLVMFLPNDKDTDTTIIFMDTGEGIQAQVSGHITNRDEILVRSLIEKSKVLGITYIVEFCETHGFKYYGGNIDYVKPPVKDSTRHVNTDRKVSDDNNTSKDS